MTMIDHLSRNARRRPFKIVGRSRSKKKCLVVGSLEELIRSGKENFSYTPEQAVATSYNVAGRPRTTNAPVSKAEWATKKNNLVKSINQYNLENANIATIIRITIFTILLCSLGFSPQKKSQHRIIKFHSALHSK